MIMILEPEAARCKGHVSMEDAFPHDVIKKRANHTLLVKGLAC